MAVVVHERPQTSKSSPPAIVILGAVAVEAATSGRILVIIGRCVVPLGRRHLGRIGGLVRGRGRGRQFRHLVLDLASFSLVEMAVALRLPLLVVSLAHRSAGHQELSGSKGENGSAGHQALSGSKGEYGPAGR